MGSVLIKYAIGKNINQLNPFGLSLSLGLGSSKFQVGLGVGVVYSMSSYFIPTWMGSWGLPFVVVVVLLLIVDC
jgi:hypothetical protein